MTQPNPQVTRLVSDSIKMKYDYKYDYKYVWSETQMQMSLFPPSRKTEVIERKPCMSPKTDFETLCNILDDATKNEPCTNNPGVSERMDNIIREHGWEPSKFWLAIAGDEEARKG